MSTTTTPNLGLIKPDLLEPMPNWADQNASNCDAIDDFFNYSENSYEPIWSAVTTAPTLGLDGTIEGTWQRLWPGLIRVEIHIDTGSGFIEGSGAYSLSLPVNAHPLLETDTAFGSGTAVGRAYIRDFTTTANSQMLTMRLRSNSTIGGDTEAGNSPSTWTDSSPFTLAHNDRITITLFYLEDTA